jgi:lysophospholipase L1-like esterase
MTAENSSWLRRHPRLALIGINLSIFLFVALIAELALRIYIPYNPGYYMSVEGNSRELIYPFGIIKINSDGYPDEEFDRSKGRNVGYFGDSVTYGVGAGHGYRFSDLLAEAYPEYEHMNFGGIGLSVSEATIAESVALADEFELDVAIYLFNLNDIVPDLAVTAAPEGAETKVPFARSMRVWLLKNADWLRGKSYLYTYMRTIAKNFLEVRGVGFHGYRAREFHPKEERAVLRETADRINLFRSTLAAKGVEFLLLLLPYEMQISQEAEETYAGLGISWEDGFIDGSTQAIIIDSLDENVRHSDLYYAFVDPNDVEKSRAVNGLGEYFVYDRGDKMDWNHPNRAGHRAIADYLIRLRIFGASKAPEAADAVDRGP